MDGGIRRGADVLKALALGADAVLLGRPYAYGLAVGGQEGVEAVIRHLSRRHRPHAGPARRPERPRARRVVDRGAVLTASPAASRSRSSSSTRPAPARRSSASRRAASATPTCTSSAPTAGASRCRCCSATRARPWSRRSAKASSTSRVGDRVVVGWRSPCGAAAGALRGARHLCRTPPGPGPADAARPTARTADRRAADRARSRRGSSSTAPPACRCGAALPPEQACLIGCSIATGVLLGAQDRAGLGGRPRRRDRLRRGRALR